ncbi:MAG: uracil-DNA glycosylase [Solirubrobacterales bacterium]
MARTIEEISAEILAHKDEDCAFEPCSTCTRMVPGNGDPHARVMLIGEAPGKNEDEQGVPFVGAAGKLLDELLASVQLDRSSVFVANVLKARPPGNRDPLPEEAAHHWPWLEEQIEAVDPDVIVLLGRHAMERFLPGRKISAIHGQPRLKDGQVYLPVYHPAAALYNGGLRATVFEDFAQLPQLVERVRATGRSALRARSGMIDGMPGSDASGGGEDLAAEFADESDIAATAPSPASFEAEYAEPLDGMEAARMIAAPFEPAAERDEPPRPAPGQPGLF